MTKMNNVCCRVGMEAPRPFRLKYWERRRWRTDELGRPLLAAETATEAGPSYGGVQESTPVPPLMQLPNDPFEW